MAKNNERLWPITLPAGLKARLAGLGARREPPATQADVVREALSLWCAREERYHAAAERLGVPRAHVTPNALLLALELERRSQTLSEALEAGGGKLSPDLQRIATGGYR